VLTSGFSASIEQEEGVVIRNSHSENQDASDVEEYNTQKSLVHGTGHVLAGVGRLAESHADKLGSEIRESRLHDARPHTQETASVAWDHSCHTVEFDAPLCKGAGFSPEQKTGPDVVRTTTKCDDQAHEDHDHDNEGFDE